MAARRKRRTRPDRVHAQIDREHAAAWSAFERHDCMPSGDRFPAIRGLLEACEAAANGGQPKKAVSAQLGASINLGEIRL